MGKERGVVIMMTKIKECCKRKKLTEEQEEFLAQCVHQLQNIKPNKD